MGKRWLDMKQLSIYQRAWFGIVGSWLFASIWVPWNSAAATDMVS
jgi:hypothetical protein